MELFDSHFHWEKDLSPEVLSFEALESGVKYLACVGGDYNSSIASRYFAERVQNAWFSVGVHPHYAGNEPWDLDKFRILLKDNKCIAVGEVGLDFYYENSSRDVQLKVFEDFCRLSAESEKPIIIHSRDKDNCFEAYSLVYGVLKKYLSDIPSFVVHCYTGNAYWMEKFLGLGAYIGITGIITFPKAGNVRELIPLIPMDKLLIETDSPYLAPKPYRGKINYPKYLKYVAEGVATIKNMETKDIAMTTTLNAKTFYNLKST